MMLLGMHLLQLCCRWDACRACVPGMEQRQCKIPSPADMIAGPGLAMGGQARLAAVNDPAGRGTLIYVLKICGMPLDAAEFCTGEAAACTEAIARRNAERDTINEKFCMGQGPTELLELLYSDGGISENLCLCLHSCLVCL